MQQHNEHIMLKHAEARQTMVARAVREVGLAAVRPRRARINRRALTAALVAGALFIAVALAWVGAAI